MSTMAEAKQTNKSDTVIKKPSLYKVVFNNDDVTPMDFVIELLKGIFHKSEDEAVKITLAIHENGKGAAGVYTFEIAEQKQNEAVYISRTNGHPLNITLEAE
jgi:ATP-dependent Clp protease adaptor protein ClpS